MGFYSLEIFLQLSKVHFENSKDAILQYLECICLQLGIAFLNIKVLWQKNLF